MITLEINTQNTVTITCSELMLDTTNYIAIRFTSEMTFQTVECLLDTNISPSIGRYDQFVIDVVPVGASADPANGIIYFDRVGHWKYDCFEWDKNTAWGPIPDNLRKVETGRALVTGTLPIQDVYQ